MDKSLRNACLRCSARDTLRSPSRSSVLPIVYPHILTKLMLSEAELHACLHMQPK
jgi:hypothetical protein